MVQCKYCGNTIGEEYIYCSYCGKDTPKMEMIKRIQDKGEADIEPKGNYVNHIRYDFSQHYLMLVLASILSFIILLCPMFQIKTVSTEKKTVEVFSSVRMNEYVDEGMQLFGKGDNIPEEIRVSAWLIIILNVIAAIMMGIFLIMLLFRKSDVSTYSFGNKAYLIAILSCILSFLIHYLMKWAIQGTGELSAGLTKVELGASLGLFITTIVVVLTKIKLLPRCYERLSHWKYLTR